MPQYTREVPLRSDPSYKTSSDEVRGHPTGSRAEDAEWSRQLPERLSEDMPGDRRRAMNQEKLPIRPATSGTSQRSKTLPVPAQLRDAPWNKPLHTGDTPPSTTPIEEALPESSQVNGVPRDAETRPPQDRGFAAPSVDGAAPSAPRVETDKMPRHTASKSADTTASVGTSYTGREKLPFERQLSRDAVQPFVQAEVRKGPAPKLYDKPLAVEGTAEGPPLEGFADLSITEDTTVYEKVAPAVIHEHVQPTVHHIREEQITREFHTHEIHHRVLPIVDVQVLPPKHYIANPNGEGYVEIPASEIPGRASDDHHGVSRNWVIAETVSRETIPMSTLPRNFTARTFEGTEGDYREWIGEDGVRRTEQTWIHPPVIHPGAKEAGITAPLHMD